MTPDEARALLDGTMPGPGEWGGGADADKALAAAAPTLAATIAGMRPEYAVRLPDGQIVGAGWGTYDTAQEDQRAWRGDGYDARIIRHYVTPEEEIA